MSRQEVGRAALRLLTSHVELEEGSEERQYYQSNSYQQQQQQQQHQPTSPGLGGSSSSYFGGSNMQITDSPSSSPNLAASHFQRFDSFPRSRSGRSRAGESSIGTPGTSDVPSLSLSNSSYSDGPLRSPLTEQDPSQSSISSTRTLMQHHNLSSAEDEGHRGSGMGEATIRRVASNLHLSIEDVRRVERCMSHDSHDSGREKSQENVLMEDIGRERFYQIVDAVRAEEERLAQLSSFRAAYLRADSDVPRRRHHPGVAPPLPSRSAGLSSPSQPGLDQGDLMERIGPIPSPRAALESLTASNSQHSHHYNPHSPILGFEQSFSRTNSHRHSYWNSSTSPYHTHSRQTSAGSRPLSLPDRSYRSMDDYTPQPPLTLASPLLRGEARLSVRRSIHGLMSSSPKQQPVISRQASRSPLIDSPQLLEDDDMEETEEDTSYVFSPQRSTFQHLQPSPTQPRQRSTSSNDYETQDAFTKASRRASAEVLGHSIKRVASPLVMQDAGNTSSGSNNSSSNTLTVSSSPPLSHEEVMARLQRKVKERLAAKSAGLDYNSSTVIVGGRSKPSKSTSSPVMSKHSSLPYGTQPGSLGRSGRRRQESLANQLPPSSARRSSSINTRKQHRATSLRGIAREMERREEANEDGEDLKMQDIGMPTDRGTAGMGIEALLSAAAIADSPRHFD